MAFANWVQFGSVSTTTSTAAITFTSATPAECKVQYGLTSAFGFVTPQDSTFAQTHSASISNLTSNTLYYYRAQCVDQGGKLAYGKMYNFTTKAVIAIQHVVDLSWTASTSLNVLGYNMYRAPTGGSFSKINAAVIASTLYTDQTVLSGAIYDYVCTAVDNLNVESIYSNQITVTVPSP